jgi:hypothetical protein
MGGYVEIKKICLIFFLLLKDMSRTRTCNPPQNYSEFINFCKFICWIEGGIYSNQNNFFNIIQIVNSSSRFEPATSPSKE